MKYYGKDHDLRKKGLTLPDLTEQEETEKRNVLGLSRLISLEGFRKLFDAVGTRSALQVNLDTHKE